MPAMWRPCERSLRNRPFGRERDEDRSFGTTDSFNLNSSNVHAPIRKKTTQNKKAAPSLRRARLAENLVEAAIAL